MILVKPITMACLLAAASLQSLPPEVLLGLLKTEGGHVGGWTTNQNGSHDLGPLQINDEAWVRKIARMQFGGSETYAKVALIYDGCYNVNVGAWIYRQYLNEAGGDYGVAVGYYNSHEPQEADQYRLRFLHSLQTLGLAHPAPAPIVAPAAPSGPVAVAANEAPGATR
jgi:hypothetical protein